MLAAREKQIATTVLVSDSAHRMSSHEGHPISAKLAVALIAVGAAVSDLLLVTTPPAHGIGGFTGRCGLLAYVAESTWEMEADACANFLRNMPNIATESGVNPPLILGNSADKANVLTAAVAVAITLTCTVSLISIIVSSARADFILSLIAVLGGLASLAALAAAEHTARVFSHGSGQQAHVGTGVYAIVGATLGHLWIRGN